MYETLKSSQPLARFASILAYNLFLNFLKRLFAGDLYLTSLMQFKKDVGEKTPFWGYKFVKHQTPFTANLSNIDICMMIGKRVDANASTLVRPNLRQGLRDESDICMMIGKRVNANASTLVRLNLRQGLRPWRSFDRRVWGASPQPLARLYLALLRSLKLATLRSLNLASLRSLNLASLRFWHITSSWTFSFKEEVICYTYRRRSEASRSCKKL